MLEEANVSSDETDDEDSDEQDNQEERNDSTETEQDMSDFDSGDDMDTEYVDTYTGKDGETMCRRRKPRVYIRVRAYNTITEPNAVKGSAVTAKTPKNPWS